MIGFVMVGTNDLDKAITFYDTLLETIDLKRVITSEKYAGYSSKKNPKEIEFYVTTPVDKKKSDVWKRYTDIIRSKIKRNS